MKNSHILPGQLVPEEIRLECYKEALEIVESGKSAFGTFQNGLCLILPCILWGLENYEQDHPNGQEWDYRETETMFPELSGISQAIYDAHHNEKPAIRIKFLTNAINQLQK